MPSSHDATDALNRSLAENDNQIALGWLHRSMKQVVAKVILRYGDAEDERQAHRTLVTTAHSRYVRSIRC